MSGTPRALPLPPVDHLVWAGPRLDREIERLETVTGVRAAPGGRHPGEGTRNALIGLGPGLYLELIGPDPAQPAPSHPRWFGLDALTSPRLVTWAARATDLVGRVASARAAGVDLGEVKDGKRALANGHVLTWRFTYPTLEPGAGLVPFLIDWGRSPHPSRAASGGIRLVELRAEHPEPAMITGPLQVLGLELKVAAGPTPALIATLDTPRGTIDLR